MGQLTSQGMASRLLNVWEIYCPYLWTCVCYKTFDWDVPVTCIRIEANVPHYVSPLKEEEEP